jgi:parallel beta-helix repeat protein
MKTKSKANLVLMILGIFLVLSHIFANNLSFYAGEHNKSTLYYDNTISEKDNLKSAKVWGIIHIENNWSAAKDAGICIGNGTYDNPYLIEDLVIDGGGVGSCIKIENSDVYFKIENCTLYNAEHDGIYLNRVINGQLIDNDCSSDEYGIFINYSHNNTISGNTVNSNSRGIYLSRSDYNTIIRNIGSNHDSFLFLDYSDNNYISKNTVNSNLDGIYLSRSAYNNITGNTANSNLYGINLYRSDFNSFTGNALNFNSYGMYLYSSDYNSITGNTPNYNSYGIYLSGSGFNNITGNTAKYNLDGIYLQSSYDSIISENIANNNNMSGIHLYNCFTNGVWGNNASYNRYHGIYLRYSLFNFISENFAIANSHVGIYLFGVYSVGNPVYGSDYTNITGNTANFNEIGILLQSSNNNTILGNSLIGNKICISEDDCLGNEFKNNSCPYNKGDEIVPTNVPPFPLGQILVASGILTVLLFIIIKKMKK